MPTGIGWSTIPFNGATQQQQQAEQLNICWRATMTVDSYCNQPLRADVVLEEQRGPDFRVTVPQDGGYGVTRLLCSRWPVIAPIAAQVSPASSFPPDWLPVPTNALRLGYFGVQTVSSASNTDASGNGPMWIELAPGYITWAAGRNSWRIQYAYVNGWPHTSLTANASAGATSIQVDDVTAWTGYAGQIYDGGSTEGITGIAVAANQPITVIGQTEQTGPGTITLASPLAFAHSAGTMVTALPYNIIWATALFAVAEALTRGATAVVVPELGGGMAAAGGGADALVKAAQDLLKPYRRIM